MRRWATERFPKHFWYLTLESLRARLAQIGCEPKKLYLSCSCAHVTPCTPPPPPIVLHATRLANAVDALISTYQGNALTRITVPKILKGPVLFFFTMSSPSSSSPKVIRSTWQLSTAVPYRLIHMNVCSSSSSDILKLSLQSHPLTKFHSVRYQIFNKIKLNQQGDESGSPSCEVNETWLQIYRDPRACWIHWIQNTVLRTKKSTFEQRGKGNAFADGNIPPQSFTSSKGRFCYHTCQHWISVFTRKRQMQMRCKT